MTLTPEKDMADPDGVKFFAIYSDGAKDAFAVPRSTLLQGPPEGRLSIARIMAHEWMAAGFIREGEIVRVQPLAILDDYLRAPC